MISLAEKIFTNKQILEYEQDLERLMHYKSKIEDIISEHNLAEDRSFDSNNINSIIQAIRINKDNLIINEVDNFKQIITSKDAEKS